MYFYQKTRSVISNNSIYLQLVGGHVDTAAAAAAGCNV